MGYYINPGVGTKESWLSKNGLNISTTSVKIWDFNSDFLPVCLVNNGLSTAAGIAYDKREAEAFLAPDDRRQKTWFMVSKSDLREFLK
jgi:hypothetical protein